jgi:formylglycine-generating enzyme
MCRVILIGTIYLLLSTMSFGQSKRTWEKTKSTNSITGYENFIIKYPEGKYTALAKQNLDSLAFSLAKQENTIESYNFFLQHYKNSSYILEANKRLDDLYYKKVVDEGTVKAYESFLEQRKNSSYTAEIKEFLGLFYMERAWIKTTEINEINEYERFLNQYPNSFHIKEATARKKLLEKQRNELDGLLKNASVQTLKDYCNANPDSPYLLKIKAAIQVMEEGGEITDLIGNGSIEINAQGQSIESVSIRIRKLVPFPIAVRIPVGSYFIPERETAQNMVATSSSKVILSDNEWQTINVPVCCANRLKGIPGINDSFTIQRSPHQDELIQLLPAFEKAGVDFATRQAAVWIITDNANYSDLGKLVNRTQYELSGGTRVIKEVTAAKAIKICIDAGIDIFSKNIWSDRQTILAGLVNDELKKFIIDLQDKEFAKKLATITKILSEANEVRAKLKASIEWATIPAGTFSMGSPRSEVGRVKDETRHEVSLSDFKISKYEVTFEQYDLFCTYTLREKPDDAGWGRGNRPVINVSWKDAVAFADWIGCRLPTEAEWEYACRAGTITAFNTGSNLTSFKANFDGTQPYNKNEVGKYRKKTMPVGSFAPNAWGLYDMHGNVREWCSDGYSNYLKEAQTNPESSETKWWEHRVYRGGSWDCRAQNCRSAYRGFEFGSPGNRLPYLGFRIVYNQ